MFYSDKFLLFYDSIQFFQVLGLWPESNWIFVMYFLEIHLKTYFFYKNYASPITQFLTPFILKWLCYFFNWSILKLANRTIFFKPNTSKLFSYYRIIFFCVWVNIHDKIHIKFLTFYLQGVCILYTFDSTFNNKCKVNLFIVDTRAVN